MRSTNDFLAVAAKGDASRVLREMRVRALWSPYYLTKVVLGYRELVDHLHLAETEIFIKRWQEGARRQWIQWPRGFFKSTTFTIGTGIWIVLPVSDEDNDYAINELGMDEEAWFARMSLHDQDATQLFAFETHRNAQKKVGEVKWHFEENAIFRNIFPEIAYQGTERPWNNDCIKIRRATDKGRRVEEGTFEAIGVDEALQSRHYKVVWEDDLIGKKATESEITMEKTIRWHGLLNGAYEDAAQQIRFGVSNRWGLNDLNNWIATHEPDFVFHTRSAWELDAETGREMAIFPERYSIAALLELKKSTNDYDFSCQYMNRPTLAGEEEIGAEKIHRYKVAEDGEIQCGCGSKFYPSQLLRYIHYDPYNAKGVRSRSRPAVVLVGTSTDQHVVLLDYFVGKEGYGRIFDKIYEFNDRCRPLLFSYEDVGNQNMCEQYLKEMTRTTEYKEAHRNFPRIVAVPIKGKANEIRIRDYLLPRFLRGKFTAREDQAHFWECINTFPNITPDHDYDLFVALAQGATLWRFPVGEDYIKEEQMKEDEYLTKLGRPYSVMPAVGRFA